MQDVHTNLIARDDTFFGVCQGLGEDLGIHPNLLRLALAVLLFWNPVAVLAGYAAAGLLVALTRWLVPNPRIAAPAQPEAEAAPAGSSLVEPEQQQLPLAA
ncbi:MAG TPA: PspC domain-containing protein [Allosphingosinicella sp.]